MEQESIKPRIGAQEVRQATQILKKYKQGKARLEQRIIDNEQFWKLRHWEQMDRRGGGGNGADPRPRSGWLVNCILSKHADAMDSYPEPTVLPREPDDSAEASRLSRILPVILKNNRFKRVYSDAWWYKLKSGCAVYGVFWDGAKLGGLGDISLRRMDLLHLFWEPGVTDIQDSPHFFSTELVNNDRLEERYPQLAGQLRRSDTVVSRYLYDETVDTADKSVVVDWYYKKNGRLHYCKYVNETVLYATENDTAVPTAETVIGADAEGQPVLGQVPCGVSMAQRGWYDHGKYPFVFDVLFPEEGTPCGYGYVDLCKSPQEQIDLMNQAILKNTLAGATPRFFIRSDGAVNEEEYADWTRPFVHTNGNLGADSIAPIPTAGLDSVYVAFLQSKIAEMKETAGNRDVNNGGVGGGVTAATAIAALQEYGGKLSRNMIDDSYDAFAQVVSLCIELIRQFYTVPRVFRLLGNGGDEFISYDGAALRRRWIDSADGGIYRVPEFDLEIAAQDETPYKTMEYNQLALQLYQMGFFRPEMADQAIRCLTLMEFKNKDRLLAAIDRSRTLLMQNQAMRGQLRTLSAVVDSVKGTHLSEALAQEGGESEMPPAAAKTRDDTNRMERQRSQTRQTAQPR
ncbi:MAG: hypothetical protein IJT78_02285 [Oscillospiraceae bacterium]|nr:hypothetical protein [Oscillospiraceae bacterium]